MKMNVKLDTILQKMVELKNIVTTLQSLGSLSMVPDLIITTHLTNLENST